MPQLSEYELGRERSLDAAVRAGKFPPERLAVWREAFDRDPDGTAQTLASLQVVPRHLRASPPPHVEDEVLAAARALFPELRRHGRESLRGGPPGHTRHLPATGVGVGGSQAVSPPATASSPPAADGNVRPEEVAAWSEALFPELRERERERSGRVTKAGD